MNVNEKYDDASFFAGFTAVCMEGNNFRPELSIGISLEKNKKLEEKSASM